MQTLDELKRECLDCTECALCEGRTNVVFGDGDPNAEVMFIGEGPGADEDRQGKPFVGRSGMLLNDMLAMIGLSRDKIYIANIVKCRPPNNRDPLGVEQDVCIKWLRAQTKIIKPKIMVCLGRIAAMRIIKPDFKITHEHGQWFERGGFLFTATFHPAALLRDPHKKPDAFEDFEALRLKISEVCERTVLE